MIVTGDKFSIAMCYLKKDIVNHDYSLSYRSI